MKKNIVLMSIIFTALLTLNIQGMATLSLHDAIENNDLEEFNVLLHTQPSSISARNAFGEQPLHKATKSAHKNEAFVINLWSHGAPINTPDDCLNTPLHYAVLNKWTDVIKFLIECGAVVNAQNRVGNTPLHQACFQGEKEIIEILQNAGADQDILNEKEYSPQEFLKKFVHKYN